MQKQVYEHFIEYVKTRRAGKLTQQDEILFNGEFWAGQTALDYGLIDGIGDMYSVMKENSVIILSFNICVLSSLGLKRNLAWEVRY